MNFIQQAYKGKNDWYLYLLTFFFVFIGWQIIGAIPLLFVAFYSSDDLGEIMRASKNGFLDLGIDSNLFLFVMIVTFAVGLVCLLFAVKKFHHRSITSLVTSRKKIDWNRFFYAFMLWFSIVVVLLVMDYLMNPENYVWNFKPIPFLVLVFISIVFMPLQTSFEELFFRGYLMQAIGAILQNKWMALLLISLLFAGVHEISVAIVDDDHVLVHIKF